MREYYCVVLRDGRYWIVDEKSVKAGDQIVRKDLSSMDAWSLAHELNRPIDATADQMLDWIERNHAEIQSPTHGPEPVDWWMVWSHNKGYTHLTLRDAIRAAMKAEKPIP